MNLINFEFDPSESFVPSKETKKWGLYTHKSRHIYAGIILPGFFQTTLFTFHLIGFFSIFILEGLAILWSFEEGSSIAIILGLAFFDIFLAIMAHRKHNEIVLNKNYVLFLEGERKTNYQRKLSSLNLYKNFFYFLIMFSAIAKFYFFFSIYFFFDAVSLLILFLYLLGGLLHVTCTGYAIFTLIFYRMISKERSKYLDSEGRDSTYDRNNPFEQVISTSEGIRLQPVEIDFHKIVERDGQYYFQTFGVLNDRQLGNMINRQIDDNARRLVAIEGIKHQEKILGV
jgi:hypothetical protein